MQRNQMPVSTPVPPCSGTVLVHEDDAVTCTSDECPRHLARTKWFSVHSTFVPCRTVAGPEGCPDCDFQSPVIVDMAAWRRARYANHPSMQDAVVHRLS
ncbi:MAG: hypothetical protein ABSG81_14130 [Acidimicrobiales bacterium]